MIVFILIHPPNKYFKEAVKFPPFKNPKWNHGALNLKIYQSAHTKGDAHRVREEKEKKGLKAANKQQKQQFDNKNLWCFSFQRADHKTTSEDSD